MNLGQLLECTIPVVKWLSRVSERVENEEGVLYLDLSREHGASETWGKWVEGRGGKCSE